MQRQHEADRGREGARPSAGKTDYDRACEFLQEALAGGRLNGNDLLLQADEAGIKRSEIMKAKKDLGVQIDISGYGKNQKAWWYMPA